MRLGQGIRPFSGMMMALAGILSAGALSAFFPAASQSAGLSPPGTGSSPVKGASGQQVLARASDVVHILETFFPPGQGHIAETGPDRQVTLDRGQNQGLYPGAVVMVYRPGPPFRDFYTGLVIGHREERVGWVELRSVAPDSSRGVFSGKGTVKAGDLFRMPESLVRVALVPASRYADLGVMSHLTRALQKSRRFSVVDPFRVDLAIRKMGKGQLSDPSFRARLARNLRAQSLILIDTTLLGDHVLLNLEIAGGISGQKAFSLETGLTGVHPLSGGGDLLAGVSPDLHAAKLPPLSVPFRTVQLPFIPFFLTEGRYIPGEGRITALSDGRRIIVGTIGKSRVRTHYRESPGSGGPLCPAGGSF